MATERAQPVSLASSLLPLKDYFNARSTKLRLVALLSPT
jgi:hypothetical protein